jgi:hypothetical protein
MATKTQKSVDMPAEVLYWTLTQGQRHRIAEQLGVVGDEKGDDLQRSQAWLSRARARGSFGKVILAADKMHRCDLRQIEDAINRFGYRRDPHEPSYERNVVLMSELEEYRQRHYQLLTYARNIVAEDRRERAFRQANGRHPLPLEA